MRAGRLRDRCRFQRPVPIEDELGNAYDGWDPIRVDPRKDYIFGDFLPLAGRDALQAGRLDGTSTGTLRIRACAVTRTIDASCRVLIDDVPYQIRGQAIDPTRRGAIIEFTVERGVPT